MSESYYSNTKTSNACQICKIKDYKEPLIQLGDFVFLCSLCNTKRGTKWTFSDAWKLRYSQGYSSRRTREPRDICYYCKNRDYLVDIFQKKHPNLMHSYRGHQECAYCKHEREVVIPRHEKTISIKQVYNQQFNAHTFGGQGASGINPDKILERVKAESEKRFHDVERRRAAYKASIQRQTEQ